MEFSKEEMGRRSTLIRKPSPTPFCRWLASLRLTRRPNNRSVPLCVRGTSGPLYLSPPFPGGPVPSAVAAPALAGSS
jgi:hypothetical protein